MITRLEDFKAYTLAMSLGEEVWAEVEKWNYFQKDTVGKQLVRAADSIAANLSEGLGRYHFSVIIRAAHCLKRAHGLLKQTTEN